jgi:hypothetical protein
LVGVVFLQSLVGVVFLQLQALSWHSFQVLAIHSLICFGVIGVAIIVSLAKENTVNNTSHTGYNKHKGNGIDTQPKQLIQKPI